MENVRARQGSSCDFILNFAVILKSPIFPFELSVPFFPDLRFYAALRFCVGLSMERAVS